MIDNLLGKEYLSISKYNEIFKEDNGIFVNLVIPPNEPTSQYNSELDLSRKSINDYTIEQSVRMKIYSYKLFSKTKKEEQQLLIEENISQEEFNYLFEEDENKAYVRLVIPSFFTKGKEMDLRGKKPLEYSLDEVVTMKQYSSYIYQHKNNNEEGL